MYSLRGNFVQLFLSRTQGPQIRYFCVQGLITQVQQPLDTFTPLIDPLSLNTLISPSRMGFEGKVVAMQIQFRANNDHRNVRFSIEAAGMISVVLLALLAPAMAQNIPQSGPGGVPEAASGPAFAFTAGYTYLTMPVTSTNSANLYGLDTTAGIDFFHHWGAVADASYVRASNTLGMGHGSYITTFLVGPVYYPFERHSFRVSLRGL